MKIVHQHGLNNVQMQIELKVIKHFYLLWLRHHPGTKCSFSYLQI